MRIDAHQHLWDYSEKQCGWIDEHMERIRRDFGPRDSKLLAVRELVERFPGQSFVLDHIAKPYIARQVLEPWASWMRAAVLGGNAAECPKLEAPTHEG